MRQNNNYRRFTFSNNKGQLNAAVDPILTFIRQALERHRNFNNILLRSKWILTELLTNATKHSGDDFICFDVRIQDKILEITKLDKGEPFFLFVNNERKDFPGDFTKKKKYVVHKDDLTVLYATVSDGILIFNAEDVERTGNTVEGINEHFGLIIITKSSDKFSYKYDSCTKTNFFTVSLML